ncbi:hypothetical protein C2E23DRAFT_810523 [Lenzites betulinus]|nr:hypothetical protein C2E23DRAFT_810523 [Lenzites betulinus]
MPAHDDHRDEAHVHSLRLALGSILSPKRPHPARSSTTSGTASPAVHCPHTAIPLATSSSTSSSHGSIHSAPTAHPVPHAHRQPALPAIESAAAHGLDDAHPRAPDALNVPAARTPPSGSVSGSSTPGGRANFIGTLQSKSAWDALIHGSWV